MRMMKRIVSILAFAFVALLASAQSGVREYDVLFHEAMLQRQKGNQDAAFDLLNRCRELCPQASETYFFLAAYYQELNMPKLALENYERAAQLSPASTTYMETLARSYITAERYKDAINVVEQMYEADKSRDELLSVLYRLYLQEEDYNKAISVLDRQELIDGKTETNSLAKSRLYMEMGDKERALGEVEALAKQYPNDLSYRTIYANTLMLNDRHEEAFSILQEVLSEEPGNVRAQLVLRNLYINEGDEAAADSVNHAILMNPRTAVDDKVAQLRQIIFESEQQQGDSTKVLNLFNDILALPNPDPDLAEMKAAYMDLKQMPRDTVRSAFEYVLTIAPDRASSRLHLVQMAWEDGNNQRVIDLCKDARQYNPEEMAFYYYQGMAFYRQEDTDNALEAFQNGISVINEESIPEIVSDFYAVMGDLLYQKGRHDEAFAAYDSCLQWKADNVGCLNNYAYYLSLRGQRLEEAEQMSFRTIKAEPDNPTYIDTYAWILFRQQRYDEAKNYMDQALQYCDSLGQESADILEHAGDIHAMCGDTERAVDMWLKAQELAPDNKLLARKIKKKKYLRK